MIDKLNRIYDAGNKANIKAVKSVMDALDPEQDKTEEILKKHRAKSQEKDASKKSA